jgi:hypothetical protein
LQVRRVDDPADPPASRRENYFSRITRIKNAPIPVTTPGEEQDAVLEEYKQLIGTKMIQNYLSKKQLFKTKCIWSVYVTYPGEDQEHDFHRHSPAFTYEGTRSPDSGLRGFLLLIFNEFDVVLKSIQHSGYTVKRIDPLDLKQVPEIESHARVGRFIRTPDSLKEKRCTTNVESTFNDCFILSVLACLKNQVCKEQGIKISRPSSIGNYVTNAPEVGARPKSWKPQYDFMGLDFSMCSLPTKMHEIDLFEEKNQIGVYIWDWKESNTRMGRVPWSSLVRQAKKIYEREIVLVLLTKNHQNHFLACLDFQKLKGVQSKVYEKFRFPIKNLWCHRCGLRVTRKDGLERHQRTINCIESRMTNFVELPDSGCMEFKSYKDIHRHPFVAYADLETATDADGGQNRVVSAAGFTVACPGNNRTRDNFVMFKTDSPLRHLIMSLLDKAYWMLNLKALPAKLTNADHENFKLATHCYACEQPFDEHRPKQSDHDHDNGKYRGAACPSCNSIMKRPDHMVVYFHNLEGYDGSHLVRTISEMMEEPDYAKMRFEVINRNNERIICIRFGPLSFRDSCHHYKTSLEQMVEAQAQKQYTAAKFPRTARWHPKAQHLEDVVRKLEFFPYRLLGHWDTPLSQLSARDYDNELKNRACSDEDFARKRAWHARLDLRTFEDEHDVYLASDVLTLADCFEAFRDTMMKQTGLDPAHSMTLPTMAYKSLCREVKGQVKLLTKKDEELCHLFNENMIGGICLPFQRYANTGPGKHLLQVDFTSLYPWAMAQSMPTGDFEEVRMSQKQCLETIRAWTNEGPIGHIFLLDIWVPNEHHDKLDFAPFGRVPIDIEQLSDKQQQLYKSLRPVMGPRIAPTLSPQSNILRHIALLQIWDEMGVEFLFRRVWRFEQKPVFKEWVERAFEQKASATTDVEKDCLKLKINAVYGKCLEDKSTRKNTRLYTQVDKWLDAATKQTTDYNLLCLSPFLGIAERAKKSKVVLDTPRYIGWTILELSKWRMYCAHYQTFRKVFGNRIVLNYMDTDSMLYSIESDNLAEDIDNVNKCKITMQGHLLGHLKDEAQALCKKRKLTDGRFTEYIGVAAKMYSLHFESSDLKYQEDIMKCKGVPSHVLLSMDSYRTFAETGQDTSVSFLRIRKRNHSTFLTEQTRRGVAGVDTKSYHLDTRSLPLGHYRIQLQQLFNAWRFCNKRKFTHIDEA